MKRDIQNQVYLFAVIVPYITKIKRETEKNIYDKIRTALAFGNKSDQPMSCGAKSMSAGARRIKWPVRNCIISHGCYLVVYLLDIRDLLVGALGLYICT